MFKINENAYLIMLEKQKQERNKLENAKQLNNQLKAKLIKLEEENKELREKFQQNEVEMIDRKNDLNNLLADLQRERRLNLEQSQRLQICKERIESMNNFIEDVRPIKEQLAFKKNVTECLTDLLVKTKLRIAESDDILQELHDYLNALEYDVDKTKNTHQQDIGHWREEFLSARLKEADVILEFDKIKRELSSINTALEEKKIIREANECRNLSTKPSINKRDKTDQLIIEQNEESTMNLIQLENEIDHLKQQMKKLTNLREDQQRKINTNEEIKAHLKEVRRSIWFREYEVNKQIELIKEKYEKLSEKMLQALNQIQKDIDNKDDIILEKTSIINTLQDFNASLEGKLKEDESINDPVAELEKQQYVLEQKILEMTDNSNNFQLNML